MLVHAGGENCVHGSFSPVFFFFSSNSLLSCSCSLFLYQPYRLIKFDIYCSTRSNQVDNQTWLDATLV